MIAPDVFLSLVREGRGSSPFKLGTIEAGYAAGRPSVVFDGEEIETTKKYPHLSSYAPAAGDRVVLARVGHTWLILGSVT